MNSLVANISHDHPTLQLVTGDTFAWNPDTKTIHYTPGHTDSPSLLLHELGHALCGHAAYTRDIELLTMEREAWEYAATTLASRYRLTIDTDLIEDSLDTYRDWLHARSTCPSCDTNGLQESLTTYRCIACLARWKVNEARTCRLKRTRLNPESK